MKLKYTLITLLMVALASLANASVIGTDGFDYPDGSIDGMAGGTGFDAGGVSDWNVLWGDGAVSGGAAISNNSGFIREFGGDEWANPVQATGQVYFGADMTVTADSIGWGGMSSFDFGSERVFFGRPGGQSELGEGGLGYYGIDISGIANGFTDISIIKDQTRRIVGCIDFANTQILLWVSPDATDFNDGASNSADLALEYYETNWSTSVRLASDAGIVWDNLVVSTDLASAVVPEPTTIALLGMGGLMFYRRRKHA